MLPLVLLALVAAPSGRFDRVNSRTPQGRSHRGLLATDSYAFFEFAPVDGAGMGTACAGSVPTGAKGEVMTFTRASTATCLKGSATTNIQAGDLVVLASNQPRVMPGGNGSGGLGLLVEAGRTNSALRSQELNSAVWAKAADGGVSLPIIAADQAIAPDGTTTAELVSFPAVTVANSFSEIYQSGTFSAGTISFFAKGGIQAGTIYCSATSTGNTWYGTTACNYVAEAWTRCTGPAMAAGASYLVCGVDLRDTGQAAQADGQDVYLWGLQLEAGAYATSYIPTAGVAVARAAETAYFATPLPAANTGSMAISIIGRPSGNDPGSNLYATAMATSAAIPPPPSDVDVLQLYSPASGGATAKCLAGNTTANLFITGAVDSSETSWRGWCAVDSVVTGGVGTNSMTASGAVSGVFSAGSYLTLSHSTNHVQYHGGVVKQVCRDHDPSRCR